MPMHAASRGPGIPFPPPFVYVACYGLAWYLNTRLEFVIDGGGATAAQTILGSALIGAGLLWMAYGVVTFLRARTSVVPDQPARQLVTWGPYGVSRNPMYLGVTAAYLGIAIVNNQAWPIVLLPLALLAIGVIVRREERYLREAFGESYDRYCQRVRRWV
jgi:protein-S-isoprenylcysteine O-methyltransferase Ste14